MSRQVFCWSEFGPSEPTSPGFPPWSGGVRLKPPGSEKPRERGSDAQRWENGMMFAQ